MTMLHLRRNPAVRLAALSLAAVAAAGPVGPNPHATAAIAPDCATAYPLADLSDGLAVTGLTVSRGTTPESFSGEILGVLKDGIGPGTDMIMAELSSPAIDKAGGIWQGMSGSPVYAPDGRLIGAVAYGLAYGGSPIAGITPFEKMQGSLGAAAEPPERVRVGDKAAARIAGASEVTTRQAEQGFRQLPMPAVVSGVDLARARALDQRAYTDDTMGARAAGAAGGAATAGIDTVVPGGNIAAVQAIGDVTAASIGTVTDVCSGRVIGFGHPMDFTGKASLGLAAASAITIQDDPLGVPFKVANVGELGGTITDDRRAGIAGTFGASPAPATFVSDVSYDGRNRVGTTDIMAPALIPATSHFSNLGNHDGVIDGIQGGSETQAWTIHGTNAGVPFTLRYTDRYRSATDVTTEGTFNLPDLLDNLRTFAGVTITSITNDADVSDEQRTYRIVKVQQRVGGTWVDVSVTNPAGVRAGKTLPLRVQLTGSDGSTRYQRYQVTIPTRLADKSGSVTFRGGNSDYDDFYGPRDLASLKKALTTRTRNDQVGITLRVGSGSAQLLSRTTTTPLSLVVGGVRTVPVRIR